MVSRMLLMRPFAEEYDKKRWWIGPVLLFCYVLLLYPVRDGLWLAAEWSDRLYAFLAVDSNWDLLFDLYDVALCLAAIWLLRRPLAQALAGLRAYPRWRLVVTLLLLPVIDEAMTWAEWLITDWLEGTMGVVSGNQSAIEEQAVGGAHTWLFILVTAVAGSSVSACCSVHPSGTPPIGTSVSITFSPVASVPALPSQSFVQFSAEMSVARHFTLFSFEQS